VLWSPEPEMTLAALSIAAELIDPLAPAVAATLTAALDELVAPTSPELSGPVGPVGRSERIMHVIGQSESWRPR
jgi:hypothetical protein